MGPKSKPQPVTLSDEQLKSIAEQAAHKIEERFIARQEEVDKEIEGLKNEDSSIRKKLDDLGQHDRLENLRIFGIPEKENEDTTKLVINLAATIGVTLTPQSFGRSHRVGKTGNGKHRAIIVFVSYADRLKLFLGKKKLKGTKTVIREDLTAARLEVLKAAEEKYPDAAIWTTGGVIIVKTDTSGNGDTIRLRSLEDVEDS